jgi:hypothetical protein
MHFLILELCAIFAPFVMNLNPSKCVSNIKFIFVKFIMIFMKMCHLILIYLKQLLYSLGKKSIYITPFCFTFVPITFLYLFE